MPGIKVLRFCHSKSKQNHKPSYSEYISKVYDSSIFIKLMIFVVKT